MPWKYNDCLVNHICIFQLSIWTKLTKLNHTPATNSATAPRPCNCTNVSYQATWIGWASELYIKNVLKLKMCASFVCPRAKIMGGGYLQRQNKHKPTEHLLEGAPSLQPGLIKSSPKYSCCIYQRGGKGKEWMCWLLLDLLWQPKADENSGQRE